LERYLKNNTLFNGQSQAVELMKMFINQAQNNRKDYRIELSRLLCVQIHPLEDFLLKDLFLNSMELKEQNLNITVADLIYVYNSLVEKQELILVEGFVNKSNG
jgi:FMN-dependent NADH-azoreductase